MKTKRTSTTSRLLRGLRWGYLVAFTNGFSLPSLLGLSIQVMDTLDTGTWYFGPILVFELWVIEFIFGAWSSLFPSVVAAVLLSLGMPRMWGKKDQKGWFRTGTGMAVGIAAAVCYTALLFYREPVLNWRDHVVLAGFLFVQQVILFGWMANRLSTNEPYLQLAEPRRVCIYIPLLNEGRSVLRPTWGEPIKENVFRVLPTRKYDPDEEQWAYPPGKVVECVLETKGESAIWVASKEYDETNG